MKVCECGSYAINPRQHGREEGRRLDLCDVCYWRTIAEEKTQPQQRAVEFAADAARYQWLKNNVGEKLTDKSLINEFSEHKCEFVFPKLISWADFCGPITLDEAIDFEIERLNASKGEQ